MNKRIGLFVVCVLACFTVILCTNGISLAKEKKKADDFTLPKNVLSISKANTFPNISEDHEIIEPSKMTKELLNGVKIPIENSDFIKLLNESVIKPTPIALGYRAEIYLGRFPLNYQSENTSVIWDYQAINKNEMNNLVGDEVQEIHYLQQAEKEIKGALTNKIDHTEIIKKMIVQKAKKKTNLSLSFSTVIGMNTKLNNFYHVPPKKKGYLHAYSPAINEKGQVTFGEVYIQLKGSTKEIEIKNVTKQGIGAWIPIQDHVSFSFELK